MTEVHNSKNANYATWPTKEDRSKWNWDQVEEVSAKKKSVWKFVPAGCQWKNGFSESRVKILKRTLHKILMTSTMKCRMLNYAELQSLLTRVANIMNDRPLGIKQFNEDDYVPITPNQLLIGRTS